MPMIEIGSVRSKEFLGFVCQPSYRERSAFIHDPSWKHGASMHPQFLPYVEEVSRTFHKHATS